MKKSILFLSLFLSAGSAVADPGVNTFGACIPDKIISTASTNATLIKSRAANLCFLSVSNKNAAPRYLHVYNLSTLPVPGTSVAKSTFIIPGNTAGAGNGPDLGKDGLTFTAGLGFSITTGEADTDATAVGAGEVIVNYGVR